MAYPSTSKNTSNVDLSSIVPFASTLKDGRNVVLLRLTPTLEDAPSLIAAMAELFNYEVDVRGDSYPTEFPLNIDEFKGYFTAYETFVLVTSCAASDKEKGTASSTDRTSDNENLSSQVAAPDTRLKATTSAADRSFRLSDPRLVGCFYVKPNWPGRCSHVCNGGFLVAPQYRYLGAAFIMGERYRHIAKALGYHASMFNLVFESNIGSNSIWLRLGFRNTGRVPFAGRVRLHATDDKASMEAMARTLRIQILGGKSETDMTEEERAWVMGPLFDSNGIAEDTKDRESYVGALQWHLDLRGDIKPISPRWLELGN